MNTPTDNAHGNVGVVVFVGLGHATLPMYICVNYVRTAWKR